MSCGFAGNADIYGIGIRIGYYTQALAVWFSNYFLYHEAKPLRATNNLFLLALCIAASIYFANASTTFVIEAFMMLQIGIIIGLVGITERSRYSSKYVKNSRERMSLRILIIMAGGFFNVYFWWSGLNNMMPTPCNNQGSRDKTYIFYLYKTDIYGWAGTLMRVKSLVALVWTAPRIVTFDAVVLLYNFRMRKTRMAFIEAVESSKTNPHGDRKANVGQRGGHPYAMEPSKVLQGPENQRPLVSLLRNEIASHRNTAKPLISGKVDVGKLQKDNKEIMKLLGGVESAIKYMEDVFSIYPNNPIASNTKRHVRLCGGSTRLAVPFHESTCTDVSTSYTQCLILYIKSNFTNKPFFDLRWMLALHMTASGQHPMSRWPRLLHRMYTLGETSPAPDWRHVAIASDILLTQIPVVITTRAWILAAVYQFLFIVVLVLQVELTIAWNHVSGLRSFSSLGQLIPFILGVGGLIKVLWGKWKLVSEGNGEEKKFVETGKYEDAMAKFLEKRKAGVERSVVRAATA